MPLVPLRKGRRFWLETVEAYLYLLPTLAVLGLFTFYPFVNAFLYSAYDIRTRTVPGAVVYTTAEGQAWVSSSPGAGFRRDWRWPSSAKGRCGMSSG